MTEMMEVRQCRRKEIMQLRLKIPYTEERRIALDSIPAKLRRSWGSAMDISISINEMVDPLELASAAVNSSYPNHDESYPLPAFFGLDPELFPESECDAFPRYNFEVSNEWGYWDLETENKWIRYIVLDNCHFLFRKDEKDEARGYVHVPLASGWYFSDDEDPDRITLKNYNLGLAFQSGDVLFPWIGLYPKAFSGVVNLAELLTPEATNPLTGLLTAKDGPTRVCAKLVAESLKKNMDGWSIEILRRL